MNPKYPIYIISKSRHDKCLTARELNEMRVPFYLVVEPQEARLYDNAKGDFGSIIQTPFSNLDKGSTPARNFVLNHSRESGNKKHWILDDNIEGFHRLNRNEKYRVSDGTIFRCCEDFSDRFENVIISGMNYHSFAKACDSVPPFYLNTRVYSCILINNKIQHQWRGLYNEDTDLCLRVLKDGDCTILFNAFLCGKVTTMRMSGGNTQHVYNRTENRREFAESLKKQHPDVVSVSWKFGRWHHQVNYKPFKKNRLKTAGDKYDYSGINNYGMNLTYGNKETESHESTTT